MTVEIPLTKGQIAIVDEIDADLADLNWYALFLKSYAGGGNFMAARATPRINGKLTTVLMHRVILSRILERPLLRTELVDHEHGNPLLNIRSELRLATRSQNAVNTGKPSTNTSGYKGVHWDKDRQKWQASIKVNGKVRFLGRYDDPVVAYKIYCAAAREYFGEFVNQEVVNG